MSFHGSMVLVTGAASGIGRAIAGEFAERGASVCIADIAEEGAVAAARELNQAGGEALAMKMDVADSSSVTEALAQLEAHRHELKALVNCAGIDMPTPLAELDEQRYDRIIGVDQKGVYLVSRAAVPLLQEGGGGAIVNISSVMAWYTAVGYVAYTTAKAGVLGMTRALAVELGPRGIRVNAICPGFIDTPIWQRNLDVMDPLAASAYSERIRAKHPVGRRGRPEDIAKATAFLCSQDAAFITGTQLVVDGGVSTQLLSG